MDAIAASPPIYFRLPEHAIAKYWNDISSAAPNTDFVIYNIPQLAGVAQMDFFYTYPGFETDSYTSSGLHDYVVIAMDNILNNGADVKTEMESLLNTLR